MASLFWFFRIPIEILREFFRNKINPLWIAKADKNTNFRLSFLSFSSMMLHPFRKLFRRAVWCSTEKGKRNQTLQTFQNQTFTLQKNRIQYEKNLSFGEVSCFAERNSLRWSEFLKNSKIISLSYAFADRKISKENINPCRWVKKQMILEFFRNSGWKSSQLCHLPFLNLKISFRL